MFETFNAEVDPFTNSWERQTCACTNDDLLQNFLDATPGQVVNMWLRFDHELASWGTEGHICDIRNSTDKDHDRLPIFKENLADLKMDDGQGTASLIYLSGNSLTYSTSLESKTSTRASRS
jgi:hypothetical protein